MNKFMVLAKGEIKRLFRYKIIVFSLIVSVIWALIIALTDLDFAVSFVPFLVLLDAGMMAILYLGASYYLEKQEGSMKSVFVSPVRLSSVLAAKIVAALFMALLSLLIVLATAYAFHSDFHAKVLLMILYTVLVVVSHTAIGYLIILTSKDFMQMLLKYMWVFLAFMVPMLLVVINVIPEDYDFLALISPSYGAQILYQSAVGIATNNVQVIFSAIYLFLLGFLLYPLVVLPKFAKSALEG